MEKPSCVEERELMIFSPLELIDEGESCTLEQNVLNENNEKISNKRRLVITTTSTEPILIEIRPNIPERLSHSLISTLAQCNIFDKECHCNKILCLEHLNLWNELYQMIHDSNTLNYSKESWFGKENINSSFFGAAKTINHKELWPNICAEALQKIKFLKKEIEKEKDERERYALALIKLSDLEEQLETEKNIQNQERQKYDNVIFELRNQVTKQAEEIRRLWTENLAIESDSENKHQEDALETKQRILELEHQLADEIKQHKTTLINQEAKCEILQLKVDDLENKQAVILLKNKECNNLKLKIEELEKENLQYQEEVILSTFGKDGDAIMLNYATLKKEYDILKEEFEKVNSDYNQTTNKLRHNVAKRRRLEAESEGEKQQRSNLAAALYELENEVEATVLIINSLQSTTFESISALRMDLQNFQEAMEKHGDSNDLKMQSSSHNDNETNAKLTDNIKEQNFIQNNEVVNSSMETFKGIPNTKSIISKLTKANEKLLNEISIVRLAIEKTLKSQNCEVSINNKVIVTKMENIEAEKETFRLKTKVLDEENQNLERENSKLRHEVSILKSAKSKLTLELKDLEKEMEDLQENLKNLREENRKLLKEAKWKSVGKQGGYQESLIVQEWEKKLKKLEADYEILRRVKKDLVKEKHHLEDELDRAVEKGYKELGGSEDRKLEDELFTMIRERNKLRKVKIALAIENVSLKESLVELKSKTDVLQTECETLWEWKEKVQKLEEDCEDLRDWKNKAEALEVECEDLRDNQMKVEAHEIECKVKKNSNVEEFGERYKKGNESLSNTREKCNNTDPLYDKGSLEEECKKLHECNIQLKEECQKLCQNLDDLEKKHKSFCDVKDKSEDSSGNHEPFSSKLMKFKTFEREKSNSNKSEVEIETKNKILHQSNTMDVEDCNIQQYIEKIVSLEHENVKLCENHQAALDKQWNVLQVDLKAFEAKVEELENECESIRRDHLSSMVENAELAREKDKLFALYNEQKYNYEILETANECLQKNQEQKESQRNRERNDYHASIDNLSRQMLELESTFCERLRQQAANYPSCLAPKTKINGRETITLTRQEYEILLAEKSVMLQERDSAHKKLCSAEIQNLQLNASLECLRQEISYKDQGYNKKEIGAEVLLAQDVVNLRSMLNSLEEELESSNCEKNKMLDMNTSMRGELNEVHEALSRCQHENQNLNVALEELNRRSSLEQIHSAASSLKEQLGKASKEKDSIKEQLNKVIKEKEQLANVASERDNVIFSLKEAIAKLEKEKEEFFSLFKIQLHNKEENEMVSFHVQDQFMAVIKERDSMKEEVKNLQSNLKSSYTKMSLVENDQIEKAKLWQKEQGGFEDKYKRIEMELDNIIKKSAMEKKTIQNDIEEAIKEKDKFEIVAKKEIKDALAKVSHFQEELLQTKQMLSENIDNAAKKIDNIIIEKNKIAQKLTEHTEKFSLLQKENENLKKVVEEKDNFALTNLSLINEQDHLLTIIANLKTEKEIISKKFEQDLQVEISSVKELLATAIMEKEELVTNEKCLQKTRDDLHLIVKSLKEQLTFLSSEKDSLLQAKEVVTLERNDLLKKFSGFNNHDEIKFKKDNFKSNNQSNGRLVDCENILKIDLQNDEHVDLIKEDTKQMPVSDMEIQYNAITKTNSTLMQEKELFVKEQERLLEELSLLKKDNNIKFGRKNKRRWNSKGSQDEIATLLSDKEQSLALETSLKQQLVDLESKELTRNSALMHEKLALLKDHDNLVAEISLLKKEKEEMEKKFDRILLQKTTSIKDLQNALTSTQHDLCTKQEENANLKEEYVQLKDENTMLIKTQENLAKENKNFIVEIILVKKENERLEKKNRDEMTQLQLLRNKLSESSDEKDQLVASKSHLIHLVDTLKAKAIAQEQLQTKLEEEITMLRQKIQTLIQDNDNLLEDCKQHAQVQNEFSCSSKTKEILLEECDSLSKRIIMLESEKEILYKKYTTTLFEKDLAFASNLSLQADVDALNKQLLYFNKKVEDLIQKNGKLHIELQSIAVVEVKMSKDQEQQTCIPILSNTNEVGLLCNMEQYANQMNDEFRKENKQPNTEPSPTTITFPNVELESLNTQLEDIKQQQDEIVKERDNLETSLKEKEQDCANVDFYRMEIITLKQKLNIFNQRQDQLSKEKDNLLQENKSLQVQCNNLQAKIFALEPKGEISDNSTKSGLKKHEVSKEKFQKHQITSLQILVKTLKEQQTNLTKENIEIALKNEVLTKERDCLLASISSLKKQYEVLFVQEIKKNKSTTLEASLKNKFEELVQIVNTLYKNQDDHATPKKLISQVIETTEIECFNLLEKVKPSEEKQFSLCLNDKHQLNDKVNHHLVTKEEELSKLQVSLIEKLDDLAKLTTCLSEKFISSMKEKEKLISEMASLKQECQKLHMALSNSKRDKDTLMKKVIESRSTFDFLSGEINRLQRQLADVEMKLGCTIAEKENAKLQISDLQMLLNNQQRMQHQPVPYSMEEIQNLEAENQCLRMEKDVLKERLNKQSMELDVMQHSLKNFTLGQHQFQQHLPSMTNFNCINQHSPFRPLLHTSSQLYLSEPDPHRRSQSSLLPILQQQWPM